MSIPILVVFHLVILQNQFAPSSEASLADTGGYEWERSGKFEGDMILDPELARNGLVNEHARWPSGIVPFRIEKFDFSEEEIQIIKEAIGEYHSKTCIRFQPKDASDNCWVTFRGNDDGCYSPVGKQSVGEQVVNLNTPNCVRRGIVIHELLHTLGFFHQQSSTERDKYVKVNWENIQEGKEHNFLKYNESTITNFGKEYDYGSIMHYSGNAFSKNDKPTMVSINGEMKLGQRKGFSEIDLAKLDAMYKKECSQRKALSSSSEHSIWSSLLDLTY